MRVFFDTEYTRPRRDAQLISLGLVAENSQEFYGICSNFRRDQCSQWVHLHVLPNLYNVEVNGPNLIKPSWTIAGALGQWLAALGPVELWGDVPAYDWILLQGLFDDAKLGLPENLKHPRTEYVIVRDLATLLECQGYDPDHERIKIANVEGARPHVAIWDARVIKACYEQLTKEPIKHERKTRGTT